MREARDIFKGIFKSRKNKRAKSESHNSYIAATIRDLRRKFILAAMITLLVALAILCTVTYLVYSQANVERSDAIIDTLYQNNGYFPPADADRTPSFDPSFTVNGETRYETRYAWVRLNSEGEPIAVNTEHIAMMDKQIAQEAAQAALNSGNERGYYTYYRYAVFHDSDGGSTVIILDCYPRQQAIMTVVRVSLLVSAACAIIVFIVLVPLSKVIARPFARNLERQQRFVTDASHELKTPLSIISANTELIEHLSGESRWTRSTKEQVARLNILISDLVDTARESERAKDASLPSFDLSEIVKRTVEDFQPLVEMSDKEIVAHVESGARVKGSRESMERLMGILLDNAIKYSDDNGRITVFLTTTRKHVVLRVSNPASELDPKDAAKVFDRFYRADTSRARTTGGSGIGLSVAQNIVLNHGGRLSSTKEGSALIITAQLPRN